MAGSTRRAQRAEVEPAIFFASGGRGAEDADPAAAGRRPRQGWLAAGFCPWLEPVGPVRLAGFGSGGARIGDQHTSRSPANTRSTPSSGSQTVTR